MRKTILTKNYAKAFKRLILLAVVLAVVTAAAVPLSLSRQIIRMHGGELSVASLPYRETCFTVSLPVKP